MEDYQQRVVTELSELALKITALRAFIRGDVFPKLPIADRDLMQDQLCLMDGYADKLRRRILRFT